MKSKIQRFEDLKVWQESISVSIEIYRISEIGQLKADFGLKDQIRRASLSISSNIAEGFEYSNNRQFIRFLKYAKGSAGELRSQLYFLKQIGMINDQFYESNYLLLINISRQLMGFIRYLQSRSGP